MWANDELFAGAENLITPGPARHDPSAFGPRGKVYDGWETRRRAHPRRRLGASSGWASPGIVRGVVVDTAYFTGNYPPLRVRRRHVPARLPVCRRSPRRGVDAAGRQGAAARATPRNVLHVAEPADRLVTHVRLTIHPDGGVARLRVHGEVGARSAAARRTRRSGRDGPRRADRRLQQHVLRVAGQRPRARPGAGHVRRLGDVAPPRRRQRLARRRARRARRRCTTRSSTRHGSSATLPAGPRSPMPTPAPSCCRARHCCPTPSTGSGCAPSAAVDHACASTSTPTAASPGCA